MKCTVYYEAWQMQCCGTPFSVGDTVKWEVLKADTVNTPVDLGDIDYIYEAHDDGAGKIMSLTGKVDEIRILYHKYALTNERMYLIPVSGKIIETDTVNGAEESIEDMQAVGYVVLLSECVIE